jgi:hypothetical protein
MLRRRAPVAQLIKVEKALSEAPSLSLSAMQVRPLRRALFPALRREGRRVRLRRHLPVAHSAALAAPRRVSHRLSMRRNH